MKKVKRRLTEEEEFQVMKLVLDKFLWVGTILMVFGIYVCISKKVIDGFWYILAGAVIMLAFAWIIIKEFERIR